VQGRSQTTQLLNLARNGNETALNRLYQRIGHRLLMLIRLRLGPSLQGKVDPEDIAQEVLIKAFSHIGAFQKDTSKSFFAWLAIIAANTIRDLSHYHESGMRDMRRTVSTDNALSERKSPHRSALSQLIWDEQLQELERALASMPEHYRMVLIMRRLEERTFGEIASIMDSTEDSCRMLFNRAMAKLCVITGN